MLLGKKSYWPVNFLPSKGEAAHVTSSGRHRRGPNPRPPPPNPLALFHAVAGAGHRHNPGGSPGWRRRGVRPHSRLLT
jgi:hypothetical protein